MSQPVSSVKRCALAMGVLAMAIALPFSAWAQGSTPSMPSAAGAMPDSAMKAAEGMMKKGAAMSDSGRAAIKAQVEHQLKAMADTLKLTAEQRAKVKPILMEQANQVKQLRSKYMGQPKTPETQAAMSKEMQAIRDAGDAKLAQVLSADQMTQYKAWRESMMAKMKARMGAMESAGSKK